MQKFGFLTTICGCMFSGKSKELDRRLQLYEVAGITVVLLNPHLNKRTNFCHDKNVTRQSVTFYPEGMALPNLTDEVIGIDEAQFLLMRAGDLEYQIDQCIKQGKIIIATCLDLDYQGKPFNDITKLLLSKADELTKLKAVCDDCHEFNATKSFRITDCQTQIEIGGKDKYVPLCNKCFYERMVKSNG